MSALTVIGFSEEEISSIYKILATILLLVSLEDGFLNRGKVDAYVVVFKT